MPVTCQVLTPRFAVKASVDQSHQSASLRTAGRHDGALRPAVDERLHVYAVDLHADPGTNRRTAASIDQERSHGRSTRGLKRRNVHDVYDVYARLQCDSFMRLDFAYLVVELVTRAGSWCLVFLGCVRFRVFAI